MFSRYVFGIVLSVVATQALAYEAECPDNAIDAIEDEDRYSHCTYAETGLNGRLKVFFEERNSTDKSKRESGAITVYDSEKVEPSIAELDESTVSAAGSSPVAADAAVAEEVPAKRVIYNIREPFTLSRGPSTAMNNLYRKMAKYCSSGWEKLAEWSEPNSKDYYIHYQFQCAK